jgi:hypothetical protein
VPVVQMILVGVAGSRIEPKPRPAMPARMRRTRVVSTGDAGARQIPGRADIAALHAATPSGVSVNKR